MYEIGALKSLFDRFDNLVFFDVETTGFNADKDDQEKTEEDGIND